MTTEYRFIHDPGHGWLEVPEADVIALGIENKISPYSYWGGGMMYLEEDCDMATFVAAKMAAEGVAFSDGEARGAWLKANIADKYMDPCFVRGLRNYDNPDYVSPWAA